MIRIRERDLKITHSLVVLQPKILSPPVFVIAWQDIVKEENDAIPSEPTEKSAGGFLSEHCPIRSVSGESRISELLMRHYEGPQITSKLFRALGPLSEDECFCQRTKLFSRRFINKQLPYRVAESFIAFAVIGPALAAHEV